MGAVGHVLAMCLGLPGAVHDYLLQTKFQQPNHNLPVGICCLDVKKTITTTFYENDVVMTHANTEKEILSALS